MMFPTRNASPQPGRKAFPAVIVFLLLGVLTALAHARLLHSSPEDKASLEPPPQQVNLWFSELLDEGFNTVEVYPADQLNSQTRTNLAGAPPKIDTQDKTHLSAPLQTLVPGKYIVDYRVLSRDGHTAPGRITFQVLKSK